MKKILIIVVIILICLNSFGQAIIQRAGPANTVNDVNLFTSNSFKIPVFADSATANLATSLDSCGKMIYVRDLAAILFRACIGYSSRRWVMISPSGIPATSNSWLVDGNTGIFTSPTDPQYIGTKTAQGFGIKTSDVNRLIMPAAGLTFLQLASDTTLNKVLTYNTSTKNWGYSYWFGGGSSSTPTWQQVLTSGNTVTTQAFINVASGLRYVDGNQAAGRVLVSDANGVASWATSASALTVPISKLTAAIASNSINNAAFSQIWNWNSFTGDGENGLAILTNTTASINSGDALFAVQLSGVNASSGVTSTGSSFVNGHSGTSSTNVAAKFSAVNANNNYAIVVPAGQGTVGIGNSIPVALLTLGTAGTTSGSFSSAGSSSGVITFNPQAAAGTFNWNWPITSGSSGNLLASGGGGASPMTWYTTTGSGTVVPLQTSPSFVTSVIGGSSFDAFNTVSTTLNIGGAATTFTLGGTPTTALTANIFANATATATTKTVNFATGGAAGSTTNVNIASVIGGTTALNSPIITIGGGTTATDLRFLEPSASGTNYTGFKAPALAGNTIYTLPNAFPAGTYLLQSTSAGVMSFLDPSTLSGLPYWALTGTSTLTGVTTIETNGNDLSIHRNSAGIKIENGLTTIGDYAGDDAGTRVVVDNASQAITLKGTNSGNGTLFIKTAAVAGSTIGDALTVVDPSTGEIGVAPNLAFRLNKGGTDLYVDNGRIWVSDSSGNKTQISPHNKKGDWIYKSTDSKGVTTEINMMEVVKLLEQQTGKKLIKTTKSKK